VASILARGRTALSPAGIAGAVLVLRRGSDDTGTTAIALGYFALWYVTLCAGTLPQLRNIEMRYFLPADILMLLPVAALLSWRSLPGRR
jgi:hypothetical protein